MDRKMFLHSPGVTDLAIPHELLVDMTLEFLTLNFSVETILSLFSDFQDPCLVLEYEASAKSLFD
jgi:hypothetical protein